MTVTAATGWGKSHLATRWAESTGAALLILPTGSIDPTTTVAAITGDTRQTGTLADLLTLDAPWLVIDDAHRLNPSAQDLVDQSIAMDLRPVLLTSRTPLPALGERHWALELGAPHLRLSLQDIAGAARAELDDDSLAARISSATHGWPAAVRILLDALHDDPSAGRAAAIHELTRPHGRLGRFYEQVVAQQAPEAQRALTMLSLQSPMTPEQLSTLKPAEASQVEAMVLAGLATRAPEQGTVDLAPGLDGILRRPDLIETPANRTLIADIARSQMDKGNIAQAVATLTTGAHPQQLSTILATHGDHLVRSGALKVVAAAVDSLPDAHRDPTIRRVQAHALAHLGQWAEALHCLEQLGVGEHGPLPAAQALVVGNIHHFRGEAELAAASYARAIPADDPDWATTLAWRSGACWLLGRNDEAKQLALQAHEAAHALKSDRALATAHTALAMVALKDGDWRANGLHYQQALRAAERAGDLLQRCRVLANLGSRHIENGEYSLGLEYTNQAITLAEPCGFAMVAALARCNRAEVWLRTGVIDAAVSDAEVSRDAYARIGSSMEAYAHCILGDARREQGRSVQARVAYERALDLAEISGDPQSRVHALIGLSRVLADTEPQRAHEAARRASHIDTGVMAIESRLAEAWVDLASGDAEAAGQRCRQAWDEARQRDNRAALAEAATLQALLESDPVPGLREAAPLWREVGAELHATRVELGIARREAPGSVETMALENRLTEAGCSPLGGTFVDRLVTGTRDLPPLVIRTLGAFSVERDGKPLPHTAWRSGKARELLKILIVLHDRQPTREEVAHLLWPDEPYPDVSNRLSVALSLLRSALGKDLDALIVAEGPRLGLNSDVVDLDVMRFRQAADRGLDAVSSGNVALAVEPLTLAERSYAGDLLEEDRYTPWIDEARDDMRNLYLSVTRTLARLLEPQEPDRVLMLWLRVLDRDPYDEPAHHEICRVLVRSGRHGEAARRHGVYAARMAELDLPAVPLLDIIGSRQQ